MYAEEVEETSKEYVISICTANCGGAGTDANVTIQINGKKGSTDYLLLDKADYDDFEQNTYDVYTVKALDVGEIIAICIKLEDYGKYGEWSPEFIVVNGTAFDLSNTWIYGERKVFSPKYKGDDTSAYLYLCDNSHYTISDGTEANEGRLMIKSGDASFSVAQNCSIVFTRSQNHIDHNTQANATIHVEAKKAPLDIRFISAEIYSTDGSALSLSSNSTVNLDLYSTNRCACASDKEAGVNVPYGAKLTIIGDGTLKAEGDKYAAGIGGNDEQAYGAIIINGGTIVARGGKYGAGIGSGDKSGKTNGDIIINDGKVSAYGGDYGAGIGGGSNSTCGAIRINGGTIYAEAPDEGAGIGSGDEASDKLGLIMITGGTITALSKDEGAGIGSGSESGDVTQIVITGGKITSSSYSYGAGIGGGRGSNGGTILISGDTTYIESNGNANGAGIGGGDCGDFDLISITGGKQIVTKGASGIGGGDKASYGNGKIEISGGTIYASGAGGAGIGTGAEATALSLIKITGGTISATGGHSGAGIGGGEKTGGGTIDISGDTTNIKAQGGLYGAGIGGGSNASVTSITISGGKIYACGGSEGAGIGSGDESNDEVGKILITGGYVEAYGGEEGAGIGSGSEATHPSLIEITGGTVYAKGGCDATWFLGDIFQTGAGIGGGYKTTGGKLKISGTAVVYAVGNYNTAGIGGGMEAGGVELEMTGGLVKTNGGTDAAGLASTTMKISGGSLYAIGNNRDGITYDTSNYYAVTVTGGCIYSANGGTETPLKNVWNVAKDSLKLFRIRIDNVPSDTIISISKILDKIDEEIEYQTYGLRTLVNKDNSAYIYVYLQSNVKPYTLEDADGVRYDVHDSFSIEQTTASVFSVSGNWLIIIAALFVAIIAVYTVILIKTKKKIAAMNANKQ
ncbi:MAG: PLAT/LH2 domain-containing protein [Clostridia bacterium]|nr:PLAT/LH2 domain-containing protein [Clostridia bacterium]